MTRPRYIGVDGGGTKTRFVLIDPDGTVLGEHDGGTTYHLQVGVEGVADELRRGFAALAQVAGVSIDDVAHVFVGLPAFGEDASIDPVLQELPRAILGHRNYTCGNDMVCGWAGSLACQDGINIVAGTGSIGYGERRGQSARAGGWGEIFGDEGSAYWLAVEGLQAFSKASDGRAERGHLYEAFKDHLQLTDDIELCSKISGPAAMSRQDVAALAPIVTEAAQLGDPHAHKICLEAGSELALVAKAIWEALSYEPDEDVPISFSGSVIEKSELVRDAFSDCLNASTKRFVQRPPRHSPSYGAALLAMRAHRGGGPANRSTLVAPAVFL